MGSSANRRWPSMLCNVVGSCEMVLVGMIRKRGFKWLQLVQSLLSQSTIV
jgi:hypothetical protein